MPDEVLRRQMMHPIRLRKRQRLAHITARTLPQRTVPSLYMRRLPWVLANRLMAPRLNHFRIGRPEITLRGTPSVAHRNATKQTTATLFAALSDDIGNHLTCPPAQGHPQPPFLFLALDKAVEFVAFKNIILLGGNERMAQGWKRPGQALQQKQHRLQRDAEDTGNAPKAESLTECFFDNVVKVFVPFGYEYAGFAAVVAEATLVAMSGVAIFDDIGAVAVRAPVGNAGDNHGSAGDR